MASLKLLVVQDDEISLELMTEVLGSLEADVRPVNDSRKAAVMVGEEKFDGIFMDLEMPNLNGFGLAQKVRQSTWNQSTPMVIVTGRDERDTMHQAFATGAAFFLQKPVDRSKVARLFRTVRGTMLENRRRSARVPLQTQVTCRIGARTTQGRTWNLSLGGVQVEAAGLRAGDAVRVLFRLPSSSVQVDALGAVLWSRENRQGIQFTKLSGQNDDQIRQFIAQVEKI